jgi:hypothetical protein
MSGFAPDFVKKSPRKFKEKRPNNKKITGLRQKIKQHSTASRNKEHVTYLRDFYATVKERKIKPKPG